ncbi:hypothetical protein FEV53_09840 [Palleronia caenipelagi]|uniref:Uncharacterized protein n=1 Tax=Palleronia caenipelagi TaxID=2489174 RepID=A0A547Q2I2_9RHOB|nr:hypothetical protein FEV53_09840 [Palleronia caenipelagi]
MAVINEFSYEGAAGEFIEIKLALDESPVGIAVETYIKSGSNAVLDRVIDLTDGTFSTDGHYDYYIFYTALTQGPREAIALTTDGEATASVAWGADQSFNIIGGSLDGTVAESIGMPLSNNSTTSLSISEAGSWVETTPTPGTTTAFFCFAGPTLIACVGGCVRPLKARIAEMTALVNRLLAQKPKDRKTLYSLHEPAVACISKGKAHKRCKFGTKVSVATTA